MVHHLFYFAVPTVESRWMKLCGGDSASERRRRAGIRAIGAQRASTLLAPDQFKRPTGKKERRIEHSAASKLPICR